MSVSEDFYLAGIAHLMTDEFTRVAKNTGISEEDWRLLTYTALWTAADRMRIMRVLDATIHGATQLAGLPKIDVPAEVVAAIIATTISPLNWPIAAAWQEGLHPAEDLSKAEETVQLERVKAGRMLALICLAKAALSNSQDWRDCHSAINQKLSRKSVKTGEKRSA